MTREDAISDAVHYARHRNSDSLIESCINDIFNDHEAQLKALYFQITELKMMEEDAQQYALRCSKELKAKDEEIERLKAELMEANEVIDAYAEVQCQMTP